MTEISITIITRNEEARIAACLESARWADEIVVVDSGSTDNTVAIAKAYGAKVFVRPFDNFADQKNFAVSKATKPWVFSLDADERIGEGLRAELLQRIRDPHASRGYYVHRDNYIFGRSLRYGGQGQDKQMRLFQPSKATFINVVHEEVRIDGPTGLLTQRLAHYTYGTINDYFKKFAQYTDLEVRRMQDKGIRFRWHQLLVKPWARFAYSYVWKGGFLDGYPGFLFHALSTFYAFVKAAKLKQAQRRLPAATPLSQSDKQVLNTVEARR